MAWKSKPKLRQRAPLTFGCTRASRRRTDGPAPLPAGGWSAQQAQPCYRPALIRDGSELGFLTDLERGQTLRIVPEVETA